MNDPNPTPEPPSRLGGTNQRVFYIPRRQPRQPQPQPERRPPQPGEPLPNFTRETRHSGGRAVIREPPVRHIEELRREAAGEEASGRIRLLGDGDEGLLRVDAVLCDARKQVEEVERRANEEVRGVWEGVEFRRRRVGRYYDRRGIEGGLGEEWEGGLEMELEGVLGRFREGVKGVYDKIARLHGTSQAERVWETLGVKDRLPSDYLKIMNDQMEHPQEPMRMRHLLARPQPGEEDELDELDELDGDTDVEEDNWEVHIDRGLRDDVAEEDIVVVSTLALE